MCVVARARRDHPFLCVTLSKCAGFTGLALKLELSYGRPRLAVRIDRDQKLEFLELSTQPTAEKAGKATMATIPVRKVPQLPPVGPKWREQMEEWALRERLERRRYVAAVCIQRAFRNYMAPIFVARQKILVSLLCNPQL